MKRNRTLLSVLLGLVLLVQGVAVSAAQCAMITGDAPVAATADSDANEEMPCHGQKGEPAQDQQASTSAHDDLSCCGDDCPNMGGCMLGHVAINTRFQLNTDHSTDAVSHLTPTDVISQIPPSLLRPPISLHG